MATPLDALTCCFGLLCSRAGDGAVMTETQENQIGVETLSRRHSEVMAKISPPRFRWVTRVGVPGTILLGVAVLFLSSASESLTPATEVAAVPVVEKESAGIAPGVAVVQAAGWIEADPYLIEATSLTDGILDEMLVLEGDTVSKGQVLARLIADDALLALDRATADFQVRKAMVAETRARLDAAQTDWDNPVERIRNMSVAEARLKESHAELGQLEAEVRVAKADLERLQSDNDRIAPLGATRVVSDSEVVDARTRMEAQEAQVDSRHRRIEAVRARIQREEAEVKAARENLRLRVEERRELDVARAAFERTQADAELARVALAEAKLRVERLEIKAPADGVIVERLKQPGSKTMLNMDDPRSAVVATLYNPSKLQVRVDVPLADAGKIAAGQRTEIVADVLPGQVFSGQVTRILHVADIQKNTLQAKVAIENPSPLLRPEMLARVKFLASAGRELSGVPNSTIHAPSRAVQDGEVRIVEEYDGKRGIANRRTVTTRGMEQDGWVEVTEGLRPGDLVITSAPSSLKPGARVRVSLLKQGRSFEHGVH